MTEQRIVIDTNVVVSAFFFGSGVPGQVFDAVYEHHKLLFSAETYAELCDVLLRSKFDRYALREERINFLETYPRLGTEIIVQTEITLCRDPKDNMFLALAIDGKADYLITSDTDLLDLNAIQETAIVTPRTFYETVIQP